MAGLVWFEKNSSEEDPERGLIQLGDRDPCCPVLIIIINICALSLKTTSGPSSKDIYYSLAV
jgi:hypothetical protein